MEQKQNKARKRSYLKSLLRDKGFKYELITTLITVSLAILVVAVLVFIPKKTTVMRNGHTLQVYSSQYAPVHDPLMCDKCIQENNKDKDDSNTLD